MKTDFIFDMETSDPDDVMTLCLLANHSKGNLKAVTVTPGTDEQIGLVKHILKETGLNIPVGAFKPGHQEKILSDFYYKWLKFKPERPNDEAYKIIKETTKNFPNLCLLTGAPLNNLSKISTTIHLKRWVAQGGFAGDNIVPEANRLEKFKGLITCPTFNFNGDPETAINLTSNQNIQKRYLVSKNVCHGIIYDENMHKRFNAVKNKSAGLNLTFRGMDIYLEKRKGGKKFHDPLALAVALDTSVCEFEEVNIYHKGNEWGARHMPGSNTFISVKADVEKMLNVLTDD